jgi:hypothetical protein
MRAPTIINAPVAAGDFFARQGSRAHEPRANPRDIMGLAMKPVGKPDAGNPHVRFDERGRETARLAQPQVTAPFLDSTRRNLSLPQASL